MNKLLMYGLIGIAVFALVLGGMFIYNRKTIEAFGSAYNLMNEDYKAVLFASGQNKSETPALIVKYEESFSRFYDSYSKNPIKPYNSDSKWIESLESIKGNIAVAKELISNNKFKEAHLELEKVRGTWQETFTRNKVTMLGFYLTQFHDIMERAIEEKDYDKLDLICKELNDSWNEVVLIQSDISSTADYQEKMNAETLNIKNFCNAVSLRSKDLEDLGAKLKSGFIPFYLKYG